MTTYLTYDGNGAVIGRHAITTRTYAVPARNAGTALNMVARRVTSCLPFGTIVNTRVTGTGSTDPDTGRPEVLVTVRGDERAHGAMLDHFAWMGW